MVSNSTSKSAQQSDSALKAQMQLLLEAIKAANSGDLTVRLDEDSEIAQEFNQLMTRNQTIAEGIDETKQVLGAIAQGTLSQRMTNEQFALSSTVNDLIDQLRAYIRELKRVIGEIGTHGNLGAIATIEGASGVWEELIADINDMSGEITQQIRSIADIARAIADGNLSTQIEAENVGEFQTLTSSVNQMIQNLQNSMAQVTEIATTVATASEELTAVSREMTGNASQTAEQATTASASAEQVSQNALTVATAIEQMNASIREIAKSAASAAIVATDAVKTSDQTNATITKLGQSSIEIGKVIKVITSIAQQTNLLALNATIEAARAGDAGRGFAVVASEVKALAKETAAATEDISQRIEAIQTDTTQAVDAIAQISTVINQINDIQTTIASAVEEQTATANEIARNVAEAAKGTSEIAKSIGIVAQNAQTTTTGANNTAQAATELAQMAVNLQMIVGQFRV
ncbi:methyl-accepting chemotaxis protein [Leptolyngbya sp. AN03gr2]|uniref:methyl-accepting chemotaxis protein n=1 Tax=unclassified Leptolyngbya TaxID=2650499 RepID=UPI003D31DE2C